MKSLASILTIPAVLAAAAPLRAQVLEVTTLNTEDVRRLDRQRTVAILPGGILEEHGPYLPSYTDGYGNERLARDHRGNDENHCPRYHPYGIHGHRMDGREATYQHQCFGEA